MARDDRLHSESSCVIWFLALRVPEGLVPVLLTIQRPNMACSFSLPGCMIFPQQVRELPNKLFVKARAASTAWRRHGVARVGPMSYMNLKIDHTWRASRHFVPSYTLTVETSPS